MSTNLARCNVCFPRLISSKLRKGGFLMGGKLHASEDLLLLNPAILAVGEGNNAISGGSERT
jgi:hypothetical protein